MWKKNKLIFIIIFVCGCSYFKNEKSSTFFKPHVEQYLNIFIEENGGINPEYHFIRIIIEILSDNEYILSIGDNIHENIYFYDDYNDTIYSCNYKGFNVLAFNNDCLVIENVTKKNVFVPPSSEGHIPISYDGISWDLTIKNRKIVDISFCEDSLVIKKLKSIPIPDNCK